jgi:hypothetical protein
MGVAVNLTDAIKAKLEETTFGTATVERQLVPKVARKDLGQLIIVALQGKASVEQDRGGEWIEYRIGIGLSYPTNSIADQESGLNMAEDIQDWISLKANRLITTVDGEFCLVPPFDMDNVFDPEQVNAAGVMFCISNFNYRFYKDRT